ncbi:family 8 carbohydrate esterase [Cercophora newfieldiana]|uniref:Pectinesterase n=1 Tax=Cercophora newfieldiana TaxID=92897 RepID=A0AA39XVF5_9PEZI|nr:family 8 carbohydrate esterase [Cercophora newfieldiana]
MKLLAPLPLATFALAASRTSPPAGCLVVSKSPSSGQYSTVSAAVNALVSSSSTAPQCIFIFPGTYAEQVTIPALKTSQLSIYGSTTDTASYGANTVTITSSLAQAHGLSNDETGTLRVKAAGTRVYNLNVENGYGKGSQAVALSAQVDSGYYGCRFTGFQDTVLANAGRQVYGRCLVQGATDFVFGRRGMAWFEGCDVRVVSASLGYVTANGRESASVESYYVFNRGTVAAAAGHSVANGAYYLGRPWGAFARVVFQRVDISAVINPAGWRIWNTGDERTGNVLFGEYGNTGAGASGARASFARKLGEPVAMATILGSGYASAAYYDASYF